MTAGQLQAVCKALAFLIKQLPKSKSERGRAERTAILQGLTNAIRPSQTLATDLPPPRSPVVGGRVSGATAPPDEPASPSIIGVNIISPGGTLPRVRAGTTAGVPFEQRTAVAVDED